MSRSLKNSLPILSLPAFSCLGERTHPGKSEQDGDYTLLIVRSIFLLLCSFLSLSSIAQQWPFELWHEGKIMLESGDTLKGQVKYDMQQDIVQFNRPNQTAEAYSARKILSFEIFDNTVRRYRLFFSLPYANNTNYKAPIFFELLEEGSMTLLAREALEYRTYNNPYFVGSYTRLVLVNKYFFLKENGNIEEFLGKKNDLLELMGKKADAVEKFIKVNRLQFDEKYDLIKIVDYYNSL
jgi:hypothetical protein